MSIVLCSESAGEQDRTRSGYIGDRVHQLHARFTTKKIPIRIFALEGGSSWTRQVNTKVSKGGHSKPWLEHMQGTRTARACTRKRIWVVAVDTVEQRRKLV